MNWLKRIFSGILIVSLSMEILGCSRTGTLEEEVLPEDASPSEYQVISIEDYVEKTTSGLLAHLVGTLSGYEAAYDYDGKLRIAMPDDWFELGNGPYAELNQHNLLEDKLLMNEETGLWEVWTDDDYHVDILDQYILADTFAQYGTFSSKCVKEGWKKYDVWDMGGGNRYEGAYALMSQKKYLPMFSGSAEYGNKYSWCGEAWIETETLGMSAAGMPNVSVDMAEVFGGVTTDNEALFWAKYWAAMYAMAYFEEDVPTLMREAQIVLPEGDWTSKVVDQVFALKEKYPDNWRDTCSELEKSCIRQHYEAGYAVQNYAEECNINNAFVLMALLYGDGDYYETCKIASLAGYHGDNNAAVALSVVGIIQGMKDLPPEVNEWYWQDGRGVIVNEVNPRTPSKYWMYCSGLPERIPIADLVDLYRQNFEHILLENDGKIEDGNYYIPKEKLRGVEAIFVEDFENGLDTWTVVGDAGLTQPGYTGNNSVQVNHGDSQDNGVYTTLTDLIPGANYRITAYVNSDPKTVAYLFAREAGADNGTYAVAGGTHYAYVKRDFIFRATSETMEIGFMVPSDINSSYSARIDNIIVSHILERKPLGDAVTIKPQTEDEGRAKKIELEIKGRYERELYLKLIFFNTSYNVVDVKMMLNGEEYANVPFSGMGVEEPIENVGNCVYVPIILNEEVNTVMLDLGAGATALNILSAEIVTVRDRW